MLKLTLKLAAASFIFGLLVGCTTLTPRQELGAVSTRVFLQESARVYGQPAPGLVIGAHTPGIAATYRRGTFYVSETILEQRWRDALLAHEVGHWLLDHDAPLRSTDRTGWHAEQYAREIAATVKGVEVLVRVKGLTERHAIQAMHGYLMSVKGAQDRAGRSAAIPLGHEPACVEIADTLKAFPGQRDWTWSLPCSPWASR